MHWEFLNKWTRLARERTTSHVTLQIKIRKNKKKKHRYFKIFTRNRLNLLVLFFNFHFMGSHLQNISYSTERNLYIVLTLVYVIKFWNVSDAKLISLTLYDVFNAVWQRSCSFAPQSYLTGPFIDVKHSKTPWFCVYCRTRNSYAIKEAHEQMMP